MIYLESTLALLFSLSQAAAETARHGYPRPTAQKVFITKERMHVAYLS
jgi:hypothetical protein